MELEETSVPECKCPKYECPPERFSVSHFIDYGIDGDGIFEPEFYEEGESPYYEWTDVNSSNSITNPAFKFFRVRRYLYITFGTVKMDIAQPIK